MKTTVVWVFVLCGIMMMVCGESARANLIWNPAELALREDRHFEGVFVVSRAVRVSYSEPDYGTGVGAGGLSWTRILGENSQDWITYSIGKEVIPSMGVGVSVRYQATTDAMKRYVTSDVGGYYELNEAWSLEILVENIVSFGVVGTEGNLKMAVHPSAKWNPTEKWQAQLECYDALNQRESRELSLRADFFPFPELGLMAGFTQGLTVSGSTWNVGVVNHSHPWSFRYMVSRGIKTNQDFLHQVGLGFSF